MTPTSIAADVSSNTNQLQVDAIKKKMTYILENKNIPSFTADGSCESLKCKCLMTFDTPLMPTPLTNLKRLKRANGVSNVCLTLL